MKSMPVMDKTDFCRLYAALSVDEQWTMRFVSCEFDNFFYRPFTLISDSFTKNYEGLSLSYIVS